MNTNETVAEAPTQIDPASLSTQAYLDTLEEEQKQSGNDSEAETQVSEEGQEQDLTDEEADGSEEAQDDVDDADSAEITDKSDLALDVVVEALKDKPKELQRYLRQTEGFAKLQEQVAEARPKVEEYDQWVMALETEEIAPKAIRNLISHVCDKFDFDEEGFIEWLRDTEPTTAKTGRTVDPDKRALETRLEMLERREQERIQQAEQDKFIKENAPRVAKAIARDYGGFKVTDQMIRTAIESHPELRTKPIEAVEFHYRKEIIRHGSQMKSSASEVKGHVVPQSHKGVGRKVDNVDPRTLTTEQWLRQIAVE